MAPEEPEPGDVDISWGDNPKPVKPQRKGIFGKIKEAFNKAIDTDVLDDDTMI
jgi:hypothetical protein